LSLTINCPVCGRRKGYEFRFGGEEKGLPPEEKDLSPRMWCDYVHMRSGTGGVQKEWWYHRDGCRSWFTIWRDTLTNVQVDEPGQDSA
jgi:sarcosine oxidase subunit delta